MRNGYLGLTGQVSLCYTVAMSNDYVGVNELVGGTITKAQESGTELYLLVEKDGFEYEVNAIAEAFLDAWGSEAHAEGELDLYVRKEEIPVDEPDAA